MLERLADLLRQKDSRAGFEATPDMLSITGMTLEQFADLMTGLGYKGEKAEREKVKAAPEPAPIDPEILKNPIPEEVSILAPPVDEPATPTEMETYYTFTWAPKPRFQRPERTARPQGEKRERPKGDRPQGDRSQGDRGTERRDAGKGGKPQGRKGGKPERDDKPRKFEARPPRPEKPVDPDNPFAALLALKGKV